MPKRTPTRGAITAQNRFGGRHPLHAVSFVAVVFVGVRFFRLFPKAQPPKVGPIKPPRGPVLIAMLYAVWIGVAGALALVLAGGLF